MRILGAKFNQAPTILTVLILGLTSTPMAYSEASKVATPELRTRQLLAPASPSALEADYRILLGAKDIRDDFNQKSVIVYRGDLNLSYYLTSWMVLNGSPTVKGATGHTQTDLGSENSNAKLILRNATADVLFMQNSRFQMGLANQKEVHSDLLMEDRGFPAARVQLKSSDSAFFQWGAFAQTAVPTSSSTTTNSRDFEPTPSFNSGGLLLGVKTKNLNWKNQLAAFEFRNLPMNVANESGFLGNTVTTTNTADTQFIYGYKGLEAIVALEATISNRWSIETKAALIKNTQAPSDYNQGSKLQLALLYIYNNNLMLKPYAQTFNIEPDAAVASYNDERLNTNRIGYRGGLKAEINHSFVLIAAGGERGLIFENTAQSRERFIELGLETLNAKF